MADANIILRGLNQPTGIDSLYSGIRQGADVAQIPMRNALLDQQVQGAQLNNQAAQQQLTQEQARFMLTDAATDAIRIKELAATDPMRAQVAIAQRIKKIQDRGGDPSDTIGVRDLLQSGNKDAFNAELDSVINAAQQSGLLSAGSSSQRDFEYIAKQGGFTPEERRDAARYQAGLISRPTEAITLASDQKLADSVVKTQSRLAGGKAGASESSKLNAQLETKPSVEKSVTLAKEQAKLVVQQSGEQRSNDTALRMYDTAMGSLADALGGTTTAPGVGWLPAMTANAQIAEGAVATMAPVLKQLFRTAGEGTFTDKDQEMLLRMIPTRSSLPEARAAQIQAIDAIVRAKLNQNPKGEADGGKGSPIDEDAAALNWARSNPNDPRAQQIMQMLGGQ